MSGFTFAGERKMAGKMGVDDILESAAAGVLRALDARAAAGKAPGGLGAHDLVRSGFNVDLIIRAGGFPGPIDILSQKQLGKIG
jgi:hypothetical protein